MKVFKVNHTVVEVQSRILYKDDTVKASELTDVEMKRLVSLGAITLFDVIEEVHDDGDGSDEKIGSVNADEVTEDEEDGDDDDEFH